MLTSAERQTRKAAEEAFKKKIEELQKQIDNLDSDSVKHTLQLLRDARTRLDTAINDAALEGWGAHHLPRIRSAVDASLEDFRRRYNAELGGLEEQAFDLGIRSVDEMLTAQAVLAPMPELSRTTLELWQGYSADLVTGLTDDMRRWVKTELNLAILGEKGPFEVIKALGKRLPGYQWEKGTPMDKALRRAEVITRTELSRVLNLSTAERQKQAAEVVPGLKKYWITAGDARVRPSHAAVERATNPALGGTPIPVEQKFIVDGYKAAGPHSVELPAEEVVQCFLPDNKISGFYNLVMRGFYQGEVIEIITASDRRLALTPNHRVLTENGWIRACHIKKSSKLLRNKREINFVSVGNNIYNKPTQIEKIFDSLFLFGKFKSRRARTADFDGDGQFLKGDIDVIFPDRELLNDLETERLKKLSQFILESKNKISAFRFSNSDFNKMGIGISPSFGCFPSFGELSLDKIFILFYLLPLQLFRFMLVASMYTRALKFSTKCITRNSRSIRNGLERLTLFVINDKLGNIETRPVNSMQLINMLINDFSNSIEISMQELRNSRDRHPLVETDDVILVKRSRYSGHVYDLQGLFSNIVLSDSLICSNCRCRSITFIKKK